MRSTLLEPAILKALLAACSWCHHGCLWATSCGIGVCWVTLSRLKISRHFILIWSTAKKMHRGCSSDVSNARLLCDRGSKVHCVKCSGNGCNNQPKQMEPSRSCVKCKDATDCAFSQLGNLSIQCIKTVEFGQQETCFTRTLEGTSRHYNREYIRINIIVKSMLNNCKILRLDRGAWLYTRRKFLRSKLVSKRRWLWDVLGRRLQQKTCTIQSMFNLQRQWTWRMRRTFRSECIRQTMRWWTISVQPKRMLHEPQK